MEAASISQGLCDSGSAIVGQTEGDGGDHPTSKIAYLLYSNAERPAVNLPPEILGSILWQACKAKVDADAPNKREISQRHRYSIMAVCHYWREVALSTPSLWNDVIIKVVNGATLASVHLQRLELERSGNRPVELNLEFRDGQRLGWSLTCDGTRILLQRMQAAKISREAHDVQDEATNQARGNPPQTLSELSIDLSRLWSFSTKSPRLVDLSSALNLRQLSVPGFITRYPSLLPPLHQLIRLKLSVGVDSDFLYNSLPNCVRLERLYLELPIAAPSSQTSANSNRILLPKLIHLSYSRPGKEDLEPNSCPHIEARNLEYLQLDNFCFHPNVNQYPSLRCLDMRRQQYDTTQLWRCLQNFPTVAELTFRSAVPEYRHTSWIFFALKLESAGRFKLLPELRVLTSECDSESNALNLIERRNRDLIEGIQEPFTVHVLNPGPKWASDWAASTINATNPFDMAYWTLEDLR